MDEKSLPALHEPPVVENGNKQRDVCAALNVGVSGLVSEDLISLSKF